MDLVYLNLDFRVPFRAVLSCPEGEPLSLFRLWLATNPTLMSILKSELLRALLKDRVDIKDYRKGKKG